MIEGNSFADSRPRVTNAKVEARILKRIDCGPQKMLVHGNAGEGGEYEAVLSAEIDDRDAFSIWSSNSTKLAISACKIDSTLCPCDTTASQCERPYCCPPDCCDVICTCCCFIEGGCSLRTKQCLRRQSDLIEICYRMEHRSAAAPRRKQPEPYEHMFRPTVMETHFTVTPGIIVSPSLRRTRNDRIPWFWPLTMSFAKTMPIAGMPQGAVGGINLYEVVEDAKWGRAITIWLRTLQLPGSGNVKYNPHPKAPSPSSQD